MGRDVNCPNIKPTNESLHVVDELAEANELYGFVSKVLRQINVNKATGPDGKCR